jgi:hypothetical protein
MRISPRLKPSSVKHKFLILIQEYLRGLLNQKSDMILYFRRNKVHTKRLRMMLGKLSLAQFEKAILPAPPTVRELLYYFSYSYRLIAL